MAAAEAVTVATLRRLQTLAPGARALPGLAGLTRSYRQLVAAYRTAARASGGRSHGPAVSPQVVVAEHRAANASLAARVPTCEPPQLAAVTTPAARG